MPSLIIQDELRALFDEFKQRLTAMDRAVTESALVVDRAGNGADTSENAKHHAALVRLRMDVLVALERYEDVASGCIHRAGPPPSSRGRP